MRLFDHTTKRWRMSQGIVQDIDHGASGGNVDAMFVTSSKDKE